MTPPMGSSIDYTPLRKSIQLDGLLNRRWTSCRLHGHGVLELQGNLVAKLGVDLLQCEVLGLVFARDG